MNKNLQKAQIPYELRKTIRFVLNPVKLSKDNKPSLNKDGLKEQLEDFIKKYEQIIISFTEFVFYTKNVSVEKELKKQIYIKHNWLRNYTKSYFFDIKESLVKLNKNGQKISNKTAINDKNILFLNEYFSNWIVENQDCVDHLKDFLAQPQKTQKRISDYSFWIRKMGKRSNFEFLFELFNGNIEHKNDNGKINEIKKLLDDCKDLLKALENMTLPSQSLGMEIERASFNYYTVNKKPKEYPKEIEAKKLALNNRHEFDQYDLNLFKNIEFKDSDKPIGELKELMKIFKAEQKSKFYEFISQGGMYNNLQNSDELKLLNDISEKNFHKFKNETNNQTKSKHFQYSFQKYKKFCKAYEAVAKSFGNTKAEIKALDKEKLNAERLQSWAVILEKDNQKYIVTIPRDAQNNLSKAKKYIDELSEESGGEWKLYFFESLTLRALDKLCFGYDKNTFYPAIKDELKNKDKTYFTNGDLKRKDQFSDDGKELVEFYKTVLSLEETKKMLAINNFEGLQEILKKDYQDTEEFEKELKQACYYKKSIFISGQTKEKIVNDFKGNLYKISSYDLEKDDEEEIKKLNNKDQFDRSNPKIHTKMWLKFWTDQNNKDKHPLRLNPEFKINFVEKRDDELENKDLGKLKKNRRLNHQFLLSTTITLQAHEKHVDLSFQKTKEIKAFIDDYNKKFNEEINPHEIHYYGLDRGQKELLTLGLFKFSENDMVQFKKEDGTEDKYHKPEFVDLEVYKIKNYLAKNEQERIAYKSPDQFIDDENVIEKISIKSCLDLSCAKLIKDKIIINGDVATYLELKRVSALRKIYEGATKNKFKSNKICFNADKGSLFLNIENKGKLENENLYFHDDKYSAILPLGTVRNELQSYLDAIKNKNTFEMLSIDTVNNLRDAICANVVGIINYLQKKYFGVVVFEDLDMNNKNKRMSEFSGNLGSRVEQKIIQKLQTLSLVPPNIKQVMQLQSAKEINQLGAVVYVDTKNTSSACPHCETVNSDKSDKWSKCEYSCKNQNCNFNTLDINKRNGLDALNNSDSVASYNIAKKGLRHLKYFT